MTTNTETAAATVEALLIRTGTSYSLRSSLHEKITESIKNDFVLGTSTLEDMARVDARATVWAWVEQFVQGAETPEQAVEAVRAQAITRLANFSTPSSTSPLANLAASATTEAWADVLRTVGY